MWRILALVFLFPTLAHGQGAPEWELLPDSPSAGRHDDVFFINENVGWVVNGGGEVHRTLDGGDTWDEMLSLPKYLRSAGFANESLGWVGALFGPEKLYETTDGGETFEDITSRIIPSISGGICGLWVVNDLVAYGVGQYNEPAYMIKTTDGGQTWASTDLGAHANTLIDVYFWDELRGIAVGGVGSFPGAIVPVIIMTEDGGQTWSTTYTGTTNSSWAWKISFPTPQIGYVSTEDAFNGPIFKTTDGGLSWTSVPVTGGGSLQGVGFITPNLGWTSGRGTTSATTDGGASWEQIALDGQINRFRFLGDSLGFAAGGRIYRYDARITTAAESLPIPDVMSLRSVYPNPFEGTLTVEYRLAAPGFVTVTVYDVLGRHIATLAEINRPSGAFTATWNGRTNSDEYAAAGVYLVRLESNGEVRTRSMTLVRR